MLLRTPIITTISQIYHLLKLFLTVRNLTSAILPTRNHHLIKRSTLHLLPLPLQLLQVKKNRQNNKETPRQNNKDDTRLLSQNLKNLLLNQKQSPHGSQGIIPMGCNGSAKKLSHSYAGSTFATNGPREAKNLPKPSFL